MTEEEIKKKADKYHLDNVTSEEVFYHSGTSEKVRKAFIDGAKSRDKEVEELKAQIEKMKCCGNCSKFKSGNCKYSLRVKDEVTTFVKMHEEVFCINYNMWEPM